MQKVWFAIGCLLVGASSADAQFRPGGKPEPLPEVLNLECGIIQTEGVKKVEDPIYKIEIYLTLDDRRNPTGLTVTHVSVSGKRYIRDEQYTKSILTNTPGKTEYFWSGTMAKNKSYTMKGTLVRTADNKWYYTEQQFAKENKLLRFEAPAIVLSTIEYPDWRKRKQRGFGVQRTPPPRKSGA